MALISSAPSVPVGAIFQKASGTAPSSPVEGQTYYDSSSDRLFVYDGTSWKDTSDFHAETFNHTNTSGITGRLILIAGGGPGGGRPSGSYGTTSGGGAGGVLNLDGIIFATSTNYTVAIGPAGADNNTINGWMTKGGDTTCIGTGVYLTAYGGGEGCAEYKKKGAYFGEYHATRTGMGNGRTLDGTANFRIGSAGGGDNTRFQGIVPGTHGQGTRGGMRDNADTQYSSYSSAGFDANWAGKGGGGAGGRGLPGDKGSPWPNSGCAQTYGGYGGTGVNLTPWVGSVGSFGGWFAGGGAGVGYQNCSGTPQGGVGVHGGGSWNNNGSGNHGGGGGAKDGTPGSGPGGSGGSGRIFLIVPTGTSVSFSNITQSSSTVNSKSVYDITATTPTATFSMT